MNDVDRFLMLQDVREIAKEIETAQTIDVVTWAEAETLAKKIKIDELDFDLIWRI